MCKIFYVSIKNYTFHFLSFLFFLAVTCDSLYADGFDSEYKIYHGDYNNDGYIDLYIERIPKIILLHGDIITPIVLPGDVDDFVLLQNPDHTFTTQSDTSDFDLTALQRTVDIVVLLRDINLDGATDLIIKNLSAVIPGVDDQIVYSPRGEERVPVGVTPITASFKQFFHELDDWAENPSFFDENAFPIFANVWHGKNLYVPEYCGTATIDNMAQLPPVRTRTVSSEPDVASQTAQLLVNCEVNWGPNANIHYDTVRYQWQELDQVGLNYSLFNQAALAFSRNYSDVFTDGDVESTDPVFEEIALEFEQVLGVEFRPWAYYSENSDDDWGVTQSGSGSIRIVLAQLDSTVTPEISRINLEWEKKQLAQDNLDMAVAMIIGDIRAGNLPSLGLEDGYFRDTLTEIDFVVVDKCSGSSVACATANNWDDGTGGPGNGVKEATVKLVINGNQTLGLAIESVVHELRHFSPENRAKFGLPPGTPGYESTPREKDAARIGREIRRYYGY